MTLLFALLLIATGLASLVCWILTLIKMFPAGVGHFVVGLICGLYAFIWGWQNKDQMGAVMPIWTLAIIVGFVARILVATAR